MVTAIIGRKVGMTQLFSADGSVQPVTVIKAGPCVVVQAKSASNDGYEAVQLALVEERPARVNKALAGHYKRANVPPTRVRREVKLHPNAAAAPLDAARGALSDSRKASHERQDGEHHVQRPPEVHLHRLVEILEAHVLVGTHLRDTRVVDQDVDATETLDHTIDGQFDGGTVRDVAGKDRDFGAAAAQVVPCAIQLVALPGDERELRAFARQLAREHEAETPGTAGDDHDAVAKVDGARLSREARRDPEASRRSGGEQTDASSCLHERPRLTSAVCYVLCAWCCAECLVLCQVPGARTRTPRLRAPFLRAIS